MKTLTYKEGEPLQLRFSLRERFLILFGRKPVLHLPDRKRNLKSIELTYEPRLLEDAK